MAAKYMGAKQLKKQIEKDQKKAAEKGNKKKGTILANKGEFLDRKKQKFDFSSSSMAMEGDFEFGQDHEEDKMPKFNKVYD